MAHDAVPPAAAIGDTNQSEMGDVHDLVVRRGVEGWISALEANRLHEWTARLADHLSDPVNQVLLQETLRCPRHLR